MTTVLDKKDDMPEAPAVRLNNAVHRLLLECSPDEEYDGMLGFVVNYGSENNGSDERGDFTMQNLLFLAHDGQWFDIVEKCYRQNELEDRLDPVVLSKVPLSSDDVAAKYSVPYIVQLLCHVKMVWDYEHRSLWKIIWSNKDDVLLLVFGGSLVYLCWLLSGFLRL